MPDYEITIVVKSAHTIHVNHPTRDAAIADAKEIARQHTEGKILDVLALNCERLEEQNG